MVWKLDSDRPIYAQLLEQMQVGIVSGRYAAGSRLPSVRELAAEAGVNPNTMQKAFTELERNGLIHTERTAGRFVTDDSRLIADVRQRLASEHLTGFLSQMKELGYEKKEIASFLKAEYEEE